MSGRRESWEMSAGELVGLMGAGRVTAVEVVEATVAQIHRLEEAGCEMVRVTVPKPEDAGALTEIKKRIGIPLICDIHFDYKMALAALEAGRITARHAVVASALFAYHGGFTGLAALLSKRSSSAGRFLGAIAAGLLPMAFAALGGLWGETVVGGLLLTTVMGGLAVFTLGSIGRRFEFGALELAGALLPSLLVQLPLAAGSSLVAKARARSGLPRSRAQRAASDLTRRR